jgi:hypothetical protein
MQKVQKVQKMQKYSYLREILKEEAEAGDHDPTLTESIMRKVRHIRNTRFHPSRNKQDTKP